MENMTAAREKLLKVLIRQRLATLRLNDCRPMATIGKKGQNGFDSRRLHWGTLFLQSSPFFWGGRCDTVHAPYRRILRGVLRRPSREVRVFVQDLQVVLPRHLLAVSDPIENNLERMDLRQLGLTTRC